MHRVYLLPYKTLKLIASELCTLLPFHELVFFKIIAVDKLWALFLLACERL